MSKPLVIGMLGTGNMGQALLSGMLNKKIVRKSQILAAEKNASLRTRLRRTFHIQFQTAREVAAESDVLFLCVKPQDSIELLNEIKDTLNPKARVVSIMAAVRIDTITRQLGINRSRVIRTMPNLGCFASEGVIGMFAPPHGKSASAVIHLVIKIFQSTGKLVTLTNERDLDRFTAIGGSGPGFLAYLIELFTAEAARLKISKEEARDLVLKMISGTCRYLEQTGIPAGTLRERVSSKGGTTVAGLKVLKQKKIHLGISKAIEAAEKRARVLGKRLGGVNG